MSECVCVCVCAYDLCMYACVYTGYQRSLLDVMFLGDAAQRTKYTMMVAVSYTHLTLPTNREV